MRTGSGSTSDILEMATEEGVGVTEPLLDEGRSSKLLDLVGEVKICASDCRLASGDDPESRNSSMLEAECVRGITSAAAAVLSGPVKKQNLRGDDKRRDIRRMERELTLTKTADNASPDSESHHRPPSPWL